MIASETTNTNIYMPPAVDAHLVLEGLSLFYGAHEAVARTDLVIPRKQVTAIIGPSGCGKSTLLRSLNRMHETVPGAYAKGRVLLDGEDIYRPDIDPILVRQRIGMVFQQPNPLRARTISQNVSIGLELHGIGRREKQAAVERALKRAALWDEVSDRLDRSGMALSGGQQQRLCLARTLAVEPELILMDEPASALDPIATLRIEELIRELVADITIVIVTHNMQQAARVSDYTMFMTLNEHGSGGVIEAGPTQMIFTAPKNKLTEDYITGRFG
ncbi:MAG TPA: phosphate ABC transporter ATP-binding protein PstB [Nitrolancea sp.]|nr:phosphate ABC transporter ATP-binding protein PstB [Nitrolancea sp.]